MKNIINLVIVMILGIVVIESVMTSGGKSNREMELAEALPSAVEESVEKLMNENGYSINDKQELVMDLIEDLSITLDSDCNLTVEIENWDTERGLLSVNVIGKYRHPHGEDTSVSCSRTVIYDKNQEKKEEESCIVKFYRTKEDMDNGKKVYKCYQIQKGDYVCEPIAPAETNASFRGWKNKEGLAADFTQPIMEDTSFYGEW